MRAFFRVEGKATCRDEGIGGGNGRKWEKLGGFGSLSEEFEEVAVDFLVGDDAGEAVGLGADGGDDGGV